MQNKLSIKRIIFILLGIGLISAVTFFAVTYLSKSKSTKLTDNPTTYTDSLGISRPIDTTIVKSTGDYAYKNTTNVFKTQFKSKPSEIGSVTFANNLGKISFHTPNDQSFGTLSSSINTYTNGSTITYPDLYPQLDLRYTVSSTRLLEEFVIKDPETAKKINDIKQIASSIDPITYTIDDQGSIYFKNNDKDFFILPRPIMYEESDNQVSSTGIKYEIKQNDKDFTITTIITDEGKAWLQDPSRKYPIVIDPTVIDDGDASANWVSSDPTYTTVSQEVTIKNGGTGSVKIQTTANTANTVDLMEYANDAAAQAAFVPATPTTNGTGGTITTSGGNTIHTFTASGTFTPPAAISVDALVVGGGGAGGSGTAGSAGNGAGGGGGKVEYTAGYAVSGAMAVTVGAGGVAKVYDGVGSVGANGGNSIFGTMTSVGGGGGGGGGYTNTRGAAGGNAGGTSPQDLGAAVSNDGGYSGGTGSTCNSPCRSGGGGGGGGAGTNGSTTQGNGGIGYLSSISGVATYYAGGGGGSGGTQGGLAGAGGAGGGGAGINFGTATSGTANTGGGGGGGGYQGAGGSGGSGRVILSYLTPPYLQSYSEPTIKTQGTYALKGIANITTSANKTLTRTIGAPVNLSNATNVTFDIRSTRTGSNLKIGIRDSGGTVTEITPNITTANVFQTVTIDLSAVTNANKDAINQIVVTVVNAAAANTFYIDNMIASVPSSIDDTVTKTVAATDHSASLSITFWVRSTTTGSVLRFEMGETTSSEQTYPITINAANTWEQKTWDISAIAAASKNAITKYAIRFTSNPAGATFYLDDVQSITPPSAPTILTATALSSTSIRWNFTDTSNNETGFKVYDGSNNLIATCATPNLTYCDETGLAIDTTYTRKVVAYNADGNSSYSGTTSKYTMAVIPSAPAVSGRLPTSVNVNPGPALNPVNTTYAIYKEAGTTCDGVGGSYVAANGADNGATAIWQTDAVWGIKSVTGLNAEQIYAFCVKARNGDNIETGFGAMGKYNAGVIPISGDFPCQDTIATNTLTTRYIDGNNPARYIVGVDAGVGSENTAKVIPSSGCAITLNSTDTLVVGSLDLSGGGSITNLTGGAEIKLNQPIWVVDSDADGYTTDGKAYFGPAPVGGRRKNLINSFSTVDCNDGSNSVYTGALSNHYADTDGDGYGAGAALNICATPGYVANNTDCSPNNASLYRTVTGYLDGDGDGIGAGSLVSAGCVGAGSYVATGTDCNDASASVYVNRTGYTDADSDGYGTTTPGTVCSGAALPAGYVANNTDCSDVSAAIHTTNITGGTVTTSGSDKIHTFTTSGTLTVTCPASLNVQSLIVGGGGAGASGIGTQIGGGGGGVVYSASMAVTSGAKTITVGTASVASSFNGTSASGGSGCYSGNGYGCGTGTNGITSTGAGGATGVGGNEGWDGSIGVHYGGSGGLGYTSSISGVSLIYGGGGGGGGSTEAVNQVAPGGTASSGAGAGGQCNSWTRPVSASAGLAGTANRGGGGGGGGKCSATYYGAAGAGSSGVVIVRYADP